MINYFSFIIEQNNNLCQKI